MFSNRVEGFFGSDSLNCDRELKAVDVANKWNSSTESYYPKAVLPETVLEMKKDFRVTPVAFRADLSVEKYTHLHSELIKQFSYLREETKESAPFVLLVDVLNDGCCEKILDICEKKGIKVFGCVHSQDIAKLSEKKDLVRSLALLVVTDNPVNYEMAGLVDYSVSVFNGAKGVESFRYGII